MGLAGGLTFAPTCALGAIETASSSSAPRTELSPKLLVRMTSGFIGNFGIGWEKPLSRHFSFGVDYRIESDSNAIIRGFDIFLRYYFWRTGTRIEQWTSREDRFTLHASWSPYIGVEGMARDYGLTRESSSSTTFTGSLSGFNGLAGLNFTTSKSTEIGIEAAFRILTSFQTDRLIKPQSLIFILTLNYLY